MIVYFRGVVMSVGKFHYSEVSQKVVPCKAKVVECPLTHGETEEECMLNFIQEKYEDDYSNYLNGVKKSTGKNDNMVKKNYIVKTYGYGDISSVLANVDLKKMDTAQLTQTLRNEAVAAGMDGEKISSAIDLAAVLHHGQRRSNRGSLKTTPYIEHPLRCATRLLRMGIKDEDIIIASISHDTIEDGSQNFMKNFVDGEKINEKTAREEYSKFFLNVYGERAYNIVKSVTNDIIDKDVEKNLTVKEKHEIYVKHVVNNVSKSEAAFFVKLSDYFDNASGLHHNDVPERELKTYKQAAKYIQLVGPFKNILKQSTLITEDKKKEAEQKLNNTKSSLSNIVNKYEKKFGEFE